MQSRWPRVIVLAGIAAWLTVAIVTWATSGPMGHDESQYAVSARDAIEGQPLRWFYLSLGMHWIARPGIWLGGSELALRALPLLLGVCFLLAAWWVARRTVGATSAAWTVVVLASTKNVVRFSTDLLSDMPSAAAMLAAFALILGEVDREEGPRWRIVLAAPLLAGAIYVRYGSVVPIAVLVVGSLIVGARTMARRPLPVIATAALFLLLFGQHLLWAYRVTGSPFGILLASGGVPQREYLAQGLVTYLTSNPMKLYGTLVPVVLVAGVVAGVAAWRMRDRKRLLAWLVAVGSLVAMGLTTHAQTRYIFFSIAILAGLGTDQLRTWLALLPPRIARVVGAVVVVALAVVWLRVVISQLRVDDARSWRMRGTLVAADLMRRDAAGTPCVVVGYHFTQLEYYSGCRAPIAIDDEAMKTMYAEGKRVYIVIDWVPNWAPVAQPHLDEILGTQHFLLMIPGEVEVVRLTSATRSAPAAPPQ